MVQRLKEEHGHTLVEILIAITIVSIVLGIASTVFVFASGQLNKWSESIDFYNTTQIADAQIYKDIMNEQQVTFTDSSLIIIAGSNEIKYNWSDGSLDRNSTEFLETIGDSLYIMTNQMSNDRIDWRVVHISQDRELRLDQTLSKRNPVYWQPIKGIRIE